MIWPWDLLAVLVISTCSDHLMEAVKDIDGHCAEYPKERQETDLDDDQLKWFDSEVSCVAIIIVIGRLSY